MAAPDRLPSPAVIVKEWMRPGDLLWLAAGLALIGAVVLVQMQVPPGDQVRIGADSAFPKFADTNRTPMQLPMIAALGWVAAKFGSHLKSPLSARIDADGIKLYADSKYGIRMKIGAPKAEAPWSAIKCVVVRRRRSRVLKVLPVWSTVLSFERPSGKRYGHGASVSPWSLGKVAAGVARFAPQVEVVDDRRGKRRVLAP
ncbi:hypothetical protein [Glycomyces harbinensis]|uniref:Uncharacterized protein n=1 Tax=Glycomyces harbinensis TaxID=58114 RepID=A0A1G7DQ93_9ACTN|nr:hypothetical protein [Glycomyces harbinensis]SDE53673.1 hypothetical protein SAMN05216270_12730 [Glycomyces harbinensis]